MYFVPFDTHLVDRRQSIGEDDTYASRTRGCNREAFGPPWFDEPLQKQCVEAVAEEAEKNLDVWRVRGK